MFESELSFEQEEWLENKVIIDERLSKIRAGLVGIDEFIDEYKGTLLIFAASSGDVDTVEWLLQNGADSTLVLSDDAESWKGHNAFHMAVHREQVEVVNALLQKEYFKVDVPIPGGDTALYTAVLRHNELLVKLLAQHGANPDAVLENGCALLENVIRLSISGYKYLESVEMLLKLRATITNKCINILIINRDIECLKLLLQYGAIPPRVSLNSALEQRSLEQERLKRLQDEVRENPKKLSKQQLLISRAIEKDTEMIELIEAALNGPDSVISLSGGKIALPREQLPSKPATSVLSSQPESKTNKQPSEHGKNPETPLVLPNIIMPSSQPKLERNSEVKSTQQLKELDSMLSKKFQELVSITKMSFTSNLMSLYFGLFVEPTSAQIEICSNLLTQAHIKYQFKPYSIGQASFEIIDETPDSFTEKLDALINGMPKNNLPVINQVPANPEEKPRLQHSKSRNDELSRLMGLPDFVRIGDAFATGDCFYDSMAQALNSLFETSEHTHQNLRQLCFNAIADLERNKSPTFTWLKNAVVSDSPGMTFEEYRMRMQFDASSLEALKASDPLIPWGDVIWGRPHIEGKLICDLLRVKLHVLEVQDDPIEGSAKQMLTEQQIDPNIDNGKSKSIETLDRNSFTPYSGFVHLLVTRGHFEPILPKQPVIEYEHHKMAQDEVLREIWLGCGHDDKNNEIIELWNKYPQYQDYVLRYHNYQVLRHAAEHSEKNFAFFFEKATQAQKEEILPLKDFQAFRVAVLEGHVGTVKLLWEAASPNMQEKLLVTKDYHHFGVALLRPQVKVIEFFWSVANEHQKTAILQKLFDNRSFSKSREWSLTKLSMNTKLYTDILEIMEQNASADQLVLIRQFPYHKILTKMPQPVEKPIQLGASSCEDSPSTPQPLAQKSVQSSIQKVDVPQASVLFRNIGVFKVEKKKSALESIISELLGEEYNVFPGILDTTLKLRKFTDSNDEEKLKCTTILTDAGIDFIIEKSVLGGVIYSIQNETSASLTNKLEKTFCSKQITVNVIGY